MKRLFIIILCLILNSCYEGTSSSELFELYNRKQNELENVCTKFLNDTSIDWICIASSFDSSKCESINKWTRCNFKKWESFDEKEQKTIYLLSKEDVLKHENISVEDYNFYFNFLKTNKLWKIMKVYKCDNCIDLEGGLNGLRFSKDKNYQFKEDFEYQKVEKLNENWYTYSRDWN
jgi:hypothetical protein